MRKTVLAYGDSLTWGLNPINQTRYINEIRWPRVLEQQFNGSIEVVEEALCGRTTCFDDKTSIDDRNGAAILPTVLGSRHPLDLVIIMLGTNDLKKFVAGSAMAACLGMKRLVNIVRSYPYMSQTEPPEIIIVSPPHLAETIHPLSLSLIHI